MVLNPNVKDYDDIRIGDHVLIVGGMWSGCHGYVYKVKRTFVYWKNARGCRCRSRKWHTEAMVVPVVVPWVPAGDADVHEIPLL